MKKNHLIPLILMTALTNAAFASVLPSLPYDQASKYSLLDRVLVTVNFKAPRGGVDTIGDIYASNDSSCGVHIFGPVAGIHVKSSQDSLTSKDFISAEQHLQGSAGHWGCLQVTYKYNNGLYKSPKILLTSNGKEYIAATPSAFTIDFTKAPVR